MRCASGADGGPRLGKFGSVDEAMASLAMLLGRPGETARGDDASVPRLVGVEVVPVVVDNE